MNDRRAGIILPFFLQSPTASFKRGGEEIGGNGRRNARISQQQFVGQGSPFRMRNEKNKKGEPVKLSGCFGEVLLHVRAMLGNHHRWKSGNRTRPFCRSGSVPYDVRCARTYHLALPYALCDVRVMC